MSTVLIVEVDPGIVALLRALLVDAVLLDVMMPDVDGVRVLDQLVEEHGATPVPVLVITGSPEAARACATRLTPADVFLKPFEPSALLDRLQVRLAEEATP